MYACPLTKPSFGESPYRMPSMASRKSSLSLVSYVWSAIAPGRENSLLNARRCRGVAGKEARLVAIFRSAGQIGGIASLGLKEPTRSKWVEASQIGRLNSDLVSFELLHLTEAGQSYQLTSLYTGSLRWLTDHLVHDFGN